MLLPVNDDDLTPFLSRRSLPSKNGRWFRGIFRESEGIQLAILNMKLPGEILPTGLICQMTFAAPSLRYVINTLVLSDPVGVFVKRGCPPIGAESTRLVWNEHLLTNILPRRAYVMAVVPSLGESLS